MVGRGWSDAKGATQIFHLIAIAYEDETIAGRALEEVGRCAEDLSLDPDAASVLICDRDGKFHLTTSRRPFATAGWSRFWGALLEALVNGVDSAGLEAAFRSWLRGALVPGSSILLLAFAGDAGERMVEMLSPFGGEAMSSPLGGDLPQRWGVKGLRFSG